MGNEVNYNERMKETLAAIKASGQRPTLFLHACCGPCLTYPLTVLAEYFKVSVGYFNPNIYPRTEWQKRLSELQRFVTFFNLERQEKVEVVVSPYDHQTFQEAAKGLESCREGEERCTKCHALRLFLSGEFAATHGFAYFTTVMTVSSHKPALLLNRLGLEMEEKFSSCRYLLSDFKKDDGQLKGIKLARELKLYRQNFCGCEFSHEAASVKER